MFVGVVVDFLFVCFFNNNSRVSDQNGVSLLFIMLDIHHSGREPSVIPWCSQFPLLLHCLVKDSTSEINVIQLCHKS